MITQEVMLRCSFFSKSSLLLLLPFFLTTLIIISTANAEPAARNKSNNDETVERLRSKLAAQGVNPLPEPPRELGVHTACVKHGRACPDAYVDFLLAQTKTSTTTRSSEESEKDAVVDDDEGEGDNNNNHEEEDDDDNNNNNDNKANNKKRKEIKRKSDFVNNMAKRGRGSQGKKSFRDDFKVNRKAPASNNDFANEAQLENLRRLRSVLRERLNEQLSEENQWQCAEAIWLRRGLYFALALNNFIVKSCWNFIMYSVLPCTLLLFSILWVFFGDRIPYQHLRGLFSSDPAFVLSDIMSRGRRSSSVAELVMEREGHNVTSNYENEENNSRGSSDNLRQFRRLSRESSVNYRRDRWLVTRFALLEAHEEYRVIRVVYKLRLLLATLVFFLLFWTFVSVLLEAKNLTNKKGGFGLLRFIFSTFCPAWMTTTFAFYFGWSWLGGMVAYAVWEIVSIGEALVRSGEKAAALHERILRRWCS